MRAEQVPVVVESSPRRAFSSLLDPWRVGAGVVALLVATPILAVVLSILHPTVDIWLHLWQTQLPKLLWNTLILILGVAAGTLSLGTSLAWLVSQYQFPGRSAFQWLLILPLAVPTYVLGFVFLAIFDYSGPVQTGLRTLFGQAIWFPEIRSWGGVTLVMILVLYPYVYILARTAFSQQAAGTLEAARSLGSGKIAIFWKVAFPLARPSIAAGLSFALMEALADFGTVSIFGYSTFTVAIYRVWFGMFNRDAATELAGLLVLVTFGLYMLERLERGRARFYQTSGTVRPVVPTVLRGWKAWSACGAASLVVGGSFLLPAGQLLAWTFQSADHDPRYVEFLLNTLWLGAAAAILAVAAAVTVAYGLRLSRGAVIATFARIASMGYALPGSVIAVGVLSPLAIVDHQLNLFLEKFFGISAGLLLTGSMVGLLFAYLVRFLAVSFHTVEANLHKITPNMDMAGRSLGVSRWGVLRRIHLPLIRGGLAAAAILVFVDVMKEMPATLLLRPFGYDTLAVRVWQLTSESLWEAAALPALTIVAAGILPVMILARALGLPFAPRINGPAKE